MRAVLKIIWCCEISPEMSTPGRSGSLPSRRRVGVCLPCHHAPVETRSRRQRRVLTVRRAVASRPGSETGIEAAIARPPCEMSACVTSTSGSGITPASHKRKSPGRLTGARHAACAPSRVSRASVRYRPRQVSRVLPTTHRAATPLPARASPHPVRSSRASPCRPRSHQWPPSHVVRCHRRS